MTKPSILADRIVEQTFKKSPAPDPTPKKRSSRSSVGLRLEHARQQRVQRDQLIRKFEEF